MTANLEAADYAARHARFHTRMDRACDALDLAYNDARQVVQPVIEAKCPECCGEGHIFVAKFSRIDPYASRQAECDRCNGDGTIMDDVEANINRRDRHMPELPRVTTPIRKLDPEAWEL